MENKRIGNGAMKSSVRKWEDMKHDVLVHIFTSLSMMDIVLNVSKVCGSWRAATRDPLIWKTKALDLTLFARAFNSTQSPYFHLSLELNSRKFMVLVKNAIKLSCGNLTTLVFDNSILVRDDDLLHAAQRTPNLKEIVIPSSRHITDQALAKALGLWRNVETLTISFNNFRPPLSFFESIGESCKKLTLLKLCSCCLDKTIAVAMVNCIPWLKILVVHCKEIPREVIEILLDEMQSLEELHLSRKSNRILPSRSQRYTEDILVDESIMEKAGKLKIFHFVQEY